MNFNNVGSVMGMAYRYANKTQKAAVNSADFAASLQGAEKTETKTVENAQLSEGEKLEAFKKEIWNEINSMPWNPNMNISIQITDGAFERMMYDSDFKDKMLNIIREESIAAQPPGDTSLTWIDENGYKGYSYINIEAGHAAFETHSNDRECFYKKKATKKIDYEDLWEEERLQKERQRERLDRDYFKSLTERRRLSQTKRAQSLTSYEAGTVISGGFYDIREA